VPPDHHLTAADVRAVRQKRLRIAAGVALTVAAVGLLHLVGVLPPG